MVKAADFGSRDDFTDGPHGPGIRSVLMQGEMEPGTMEKSTDANCAAWFFRKVFQF
jgi:hypothetical protein